MGPALERTVIDHLLEGAEGGDRADRAPEIGLFRHTLIRPVDRSSYGDESRSDRQHDVQRFEPGVRCGQGAERASGRVSFESATRWRPSASKLAGASQRA